MQDTVQLLSIDVKDYPGSLERIFLYFFFNSLCIRAIDVAWNITYMNPNVEDTALNVYIHICTAEEVA